MTSTKLCGGTFYKSNLSNSEFKNVNISGVNFNEADLSNVKWENIKINELPSFSGHTDGVNCVDFSSSIEEMIIATGSKDRTIRIWNLQTKKSIILKGHTKEVKILKFSNNDKNILASGGDDRTIRFWNINE